MVRVSDMDMYYEVQGDGPPLVLLHAYLGTGYFQWKAYIDRGASRTCRMCVQSTADATSDATSLPTDVDQLQSQ